MPKIIPSTGTTTKALKTAGITTLSLLFGSALPLGTIWMPLIAGTVMKDNTAITLGTTIGTVLAFGALGGAQGTGSAEVI